MSEVDLEVEYLERLLRDLVEGLDVDLATRANDGIRSGTRLRRRRQAYGATGVASGLVAAAVAVTIAAHVNTWSGSTAPGFASNPTAVPPATHHPAPAACRLAVHPTGPNGYVHGTTASGHRPGPASLNKARTSTKHESPGYARLPSHADMEAKCRQILASSADSTATGVPEKLPVTLVSPGWSCQPPGDEKFICTNGPASVQVTVRPANLHNAYLTDPDKASPDQYVSAVHGDSFATINPGPHSGNVSVQDLGRDLAWK